MAKICARMEIPLPGRGYWRRKETGHRVENRPLRKLTQKGVSEVTIQKKVKSSDSGEQTQKPKSPDLQKWEEFELRPENQILVSPTLDNPLPLIAQTERSLRGARPDRDGFVSPKAKGAMRVTVGPLNVDRAMRIMDALLKAFRTRGIPLKSSEEKRLLGAVTILGETIAFRIEEKIKQIPHVMTKEERDRKKKFEWATPPAFDRLPSGLLALRIHKDFYGRSRERWLEDEKRKLEDDLNGFLIGLARAAEAKKAWKIEQARREEERTIAAQKHHEEQMRRWEEELKIKELEDEIAAWERARRIRTYADAGEALGREHFGEAYSDSMLAKRLAWARRVADRIDPLAIHS